MATDDTRRGTAATSANTRGRGLKGVLHRLTASEQELESEELREETERAGCECVEDVHRGQLVSVTGRLRTVVYTPRTNLPTLEADLYDGTDVVTLVFLGRRHIPGVEPGRALTARGRVALRDGRKVIYNPHYELEAAR
ncbi:OB-fold nucleic acid binding domain-containing protein [Allorhizocola rhizosphaerae]|uniref:OB-fold nucleic acid binding domain-containing protein n=1 Tax=Allorhizocola rhizosphaerae TaxID=1872709 RepID=UPI000E3ECA7F|nr:OB-fold nucleic acid binding domain-containing protein [Allorhizocola rhizosphaerae]